MSGSNTTINALVALRQTGGQALADTRLSLRILRERDKTKNNDFKYNNIPDLLHRCEILKLRSALESISSAHLPRPEQTPRHSPTVMSEYYSEIVYRKFTT